MNKRYYMLKAKIVDRSGFGIAIAPCDNETYLELPIGVSVGQYVYCPLCEEYHYVQSVNEHAMLLFE